MKKLFLLYFLGAFLLAASQTVEAKKYLKVSQPLSSVSKEALIQKTLAEKMALPSKSMISTLDAAEISKLNPEIDPGISSFEKIQELNAKLNEEIKFMAPSLHIAWQKQRRNYCLFLYTKNFSLHFLTETALKEGSL